MKLLEQGARRKGVELEPQFLKHKNNGTRRGHRRRRLRRGLFRGPLSAVDDELPQDGPGPYYVFYRPYHLSHVEAMQCVAEAHLDGYSLIEPVYGFQTNVMAYAKKELHAGTTLDGIGGYTCYGLIENMDGAQDGVPICLAENIVLMRDVHKDERLTLEDRSSLSALISSSTRPQNR